MVTKACFKRRILHASNSINIRSRAATITQRHAVLKHNGLAPLMHVCLAQYGVMAKTCQQ